jgi:NAD(P)-dependent dehydrogenase (short-subunit alcohol dehydrogenase family)
VDISACSTIVTGGASGLGEASARLLAKNGAKVTLFDLNHERGEQIANEIDGLFVSADISNEEDISKGLEQATERHGDIRILVNCAGVAHGQKTSSKGIPHSLADFERIININLVGTFNCIRLVATRMAAQDPANEEERGVIINTSSVVAFDGQLGQAAYAASKAGIVGMTLPIARDLSRSGIRVVTIAPGIFSTPMMAGLPEEAQEALNASVPFPPRLGKPEEFSAMVKHICENSYLNGETIRLDGAIRLAAK